MAEIQAPVLPTTILTATRKRSGQGSLGEIAYQQIKDRIISLELPPASLMDESQLMQDLGLGRTPIREAVQRLAWENLVVILPRRGMFVGAEAILQAGQQRELIQLDHRAHQLIARASHNEYLAESLERLFSHTLRLWLVSLHKVGRLREMIEEHREVIAAVKTGDCGRAGRVMRAHIEGFQGVFKGVL